MGGSDPWLGPDHLPVPREEYVAWLDIMGTGRIMQWSPKTGTINVGKLIVAAIEAKKSPHMQFYPVMDGIYFTHKRETSLIATFWDIFLRFANVLIERYEKSHTPNIHLSPILRAGIAHGDVYHGVDFDETAVSSHHFNEALLSGKPVADAHFAESSAPPFGIKLAPSAADGETSELIEWWQVESHGKRMKRALNGYFDFYEGRTHPKYPDRKIRKHRKMMEEYFP